MVALIFGYRSVARRRAGLLLIVFPAALLFAMLAFGFSSETAVLRLLKPGIAQRSLRIGTIGGMTSWDASGFSQSEVNRLGTVPGATPGPATFKRCYADPNNRRELNCGLTNRTYVQIWYIDVPVSEQDLDRWDAVKNGVIVTRWAADLHHWKVGDQITLRFDRGLGKDVPLELQITSIAEKYVDPTTTYVHDAFFNQRLKLDLHYWVVWILVDTPEHRPEVMDLIEKKLTEMSHPHILWTMETSQQTVLAGSEILRSAFRIAGGASFFLVVFVTVALLILSVEQRQMEIAVLLAIGFRRAAIARSVFVEGLLLILPSSLIGTLVTWYALHNDPITFTEGFRVVISLTDVALTVGVSILIGIGAAIVPAWRVFRLDVLGSMR